MIWTEVVLPIVIRINVHQKECAGIFPAGENVVYTSSLDEPRILDLSKMLLEKKEVRSVHSASFFMRFLGQDSR